MINLISHLGVALSAPMREPIDSSRRGEHQRYRKLMRHWVKENAAWSLRGRFYLSLGQRSVWILLSSIEMLTHNFVSKTCLTTHHLQLTSSLSSLLLLSQYLITLLFSLFSPRKIQAPFTSSIVINPPPPLHEPPRFLFSLILIILPHPKNFE